MSVSTHLHHLLDGPYSKSIKDLISSHPGKIRWLRYIERSLRNDKLIVDGTFVATAPTKVRVDLGASKRSAIRFYDGSKGRHKSFFAGPLLTSNPEKLSKLAFIPNRHKKPHWWVKQSIRRIEKQLVKRIPGQLPEEGVLDTATIFTKALKRIHVSKTNYLLQNLLIQPKVPIVVLSQVSEMVRQRFHQLEFDEQAHALLVILRKTNNIPIEKIPELPLAVAHMFRGLASKMDSKRHQISTLQELLLQLALSKDHNLLQVAAGKQHISEVVGMTEMNESQTSGQGKEVELIHAYKRFGDATVRSMCFSIQSALLDAEVEGRKRLGLPPPSLPSVTSPPQLTLSANVLADILASSAALGFTSKNHAAMWEGSMMLLGANGSPPLSPPEGFVAPGIIFDAPLYSISLRAAALPLPQLMSLTHTLTNLTANSGRGEHEGEKRRHLKGMETKVTDALVASNKIFENACDDVKSFAYVSMGILLKEGILPLVNSKKDMHELGPLFKMLPDFFILPHLNSNLPPSSHFLPVGVPAPNETIAEMKKTLLAKHSLDMHILPSDGYTSTSIGNKRDKTKFKKISSSRNPFNSLNPQDSLTALDVDEEMSRSQRHALPYSLEHHPDEEGKMDGRYFPIANDRAVNDLMKLIETFAELCLTEEERAELLASKLDPRTRDLHANGSRALPVGLWRLSAERARSTLHGLKTRQLSLIVKQTCQDMGGLQIPPALVRTGGDMGRSQFVVEASAIRPHKSKEKARAFIDTLGEVVAFRAEETNAGGLASSLRGLGVLYRKGLLSEGVAVQLVEDALPILTSNVRKLHPNDLADLMHACGSFATFLKGKPSLNNEQQRPNGDQIDGLSLMTEFATSGIASPSLAGVRAHLFQMLSAKRPRYQISNDFHDYKENPTPRFLSPGHIAAVSIGLRQLCTPQVARRYSRIYSEGAEETYPFVDAYLSLVTNLKQEHGELFAPLLSVCLETIRSLGVTDHPLAVRLAARASYMLLDERTSILPPMHALPLTASQEDIDEAHSAYKMECDSARLRLLHASLTTFAERAHSGDKLAQRVDPDFVGRMATVMLAGLPILKMPDDSSVMIPQMVENLLTLIEAAEKQPVVFEDQMVERNQNFVEHALPATENSSLIVINDNFGKKNNLAAGLKSHQLNSTQNRLSNLPGFYSGSELNEGDVSMHPSSISMRAHNAIQQSYLLNDGQVSWGLKIRERSQLLAKRLGYENGRASKHYSDSNYSIDLYYKPETVQQSKHFLTVFSELKNDLLDPQDAKLSLVTGRRSDANELERERNRLAKSSHIKAIYLQDEALRSENISSLKQSRAFRRPLNIALVNIEKKHNKNTSKNEIESEKPVERNDYVTMLRALPGVNWSFPAAEVNAASRLLGDDHPASKHSKGDELLAASRQKQIDDLVRKERALAAFEREELQKIKKVRTQRQTKKESSDCISAEKLETDQQNNLISLQSSPKRNKNVLNDIEHLEGPMAKQLRPQLANEEDWSSLAWSAVEKSIFALLADKDFLTRDSKSIERAELLLKNKKEFIEKQNHSIRNIFLELKDEVERINEMKHSTNKLERPIK